VERDCKVYVPMSGRYTANPETVRKFKEAGIPITEDEIVLGQVMGFAILGPMSRKAAKFVIEHLAGVGLTASLIKHQSGHAPRRPSPFEQALGQFGTIGSKYLA